MSRYGSSPNDWPSEEPTEEEEYDPAIDLPCPGPYSWEHRERTCGCFAMPQAEIDRREAEMERQS